MHQVIKVTGLAAIVTAAIIAGSSNVDAETKPYSPPGAAEDAADAPIAQACQYGYYQCTSNPSLTWEWISTAGCAEECAGWDSTPKATAGAQCQAGCPQGFCKLHTIGTCPI